MHTFHCVFVMLGVLLCVGGGCAQARNMTLWPFASWSIWNLPIGRDAKYVPANIKLASDGTTVDADVLLLDPTLPVTPVWFNSDAWSGKSRCNVEGKELFRAPFPADYVIHGAGPGLGTPNNAAAFLDQDGITLRQTQPIAHCTASGPVTSWTSVPNVTLNGDGILGAHGGSGLSSIGGTLRLGELVPNAAPIRHALKVELDCRTNYYWNPKVPSECYRWPATHCDGPSAHYNGTNPAVVPGSLLALDTSINIKDMGLETEPALMLAWTLQNYGAYIVDSAGGDVYCLCTEESPQGNVEDEFTSAWGYSIAEWRKDTPWSRDVAKLYMSLSVVDNWNLDLYNDVRASDGAQGAGGGDPLQPWAAPV